MKTATTATTESQPTWISNDPRTIPAANSIPTMPTITRSRRVGVIPTRQTGKTPRASATPVSMFPLAMTSIAGRTLSAPWIASDRTQRSPPFALVRSWDIVPPC
jgi:hypothetical protein